MSIEQKFMNKFKLQTGEIFKYNDFNYKFEKCNNNLYLYIKGSDHWLQVITAVATMAEILLDDKGIIKSDKLVDGDYFYYLKFTNKKGYDSGYFADWSQEDNSVQDFGVVARSEQDIINMRDKVLAFVKSLNEL